MGELPHMLGAIFGVKRSPKAAAAKSKKQPKMKAVTALHDTGSPLANAQNEPVSDKKIMKDNAKHSVRRATEDWVSGHITTKECCAVHDRAKHVLSGKRPMEFKGPSGERSFKKMR
jgi:hypothetical protein